MGLGKTFQCVTIVWTLLVSVDCDIAVAQLIVAVRLPFH